MGISDGLLVLLQKTGFFVYYPLTNPNKTVRYHYWDHEMEKGRIHNAFENDIQHLSNWMFMT